MPSTFADGTETSRFDMVVPREHNQAVDTLRTKVGEIDSALSDVQKAVQAMPVELHQQCSEMCDAVISKADEMDDERTNMVTSMVVMETAYLKRFYMGHLMRFLNFFGQWFIYGTIHGVEYIFPNEPVNEQYGKAPMLTRIRRRFKRVFKKKNH